MSDRNETIGSNFLIASQVFNTRDQTVNIGKRILLINLLSKFLQSFCDPASFTGALSQTVFAKLFLFSRLGLIETNRDK